MAFRYTRTVAPTTTPISLDEAKAQLRYPDNDYDEEITGFISSVTEHLDGPNGTLGRCIVTQTWEIGCVFPQSHGTNGYIPVRIGDLQSVTSIAYYDTDDVLQTVDLNDVNIITGQNGLMYLKDGAAWPSTSSDRIDPVTITVIVGYPTDGTSPTEDGLRGNIPDGLRHAMKLYLSHMFENRDIMAFGVNVTKIPETYDALIAPHRITEHGNG